MQNVSTHRTDYFVIGLIGIFFLLFKILHAWYGFHWEFAAGFSYGLYAIALLYSVLSRNRFLQKVLIFGMLAGLTELISDWWLVDVKQSLVYPLNEPLLWASPLYMPVSWAVIFLQIGGLSYWIYEKRNLAYARLVALLCGLLFVPFFEYWAGMEGWWYYQHCAMIFGKVPWYIIFSEAAICFVLPDLMIRIANRNTGFCILAGIGQGLWIWFTCMIAYYFSA